MLHLYGVPVTPENARHLVATLMADGGLDAKSAAPMIEKGVDRDLYAVALEPAERDAILSVLEDADYVTLAVTGAGSARVGDGLRVLRTAQGVSAETDVDMRS
jgi:hypothetical protein